MEYVLFRLQDRMKVLDMLDNKCFDYTGFTIHASDVGGQNQIVLRNTVLTANAPSRPLIPSLTGRASNSKLTDEG